MIPFYILPVNLEDHQLGWVSNNIVYTFVLLFSRHPKHLEVLTWTFFNSPLCVNLKNVQFVIILGNLHRDSSKILKGRHLLKNYIFLLLNQELEH